MGSWLVREEGWEGGGGEGGAGGAASSRCSFMEVVDMPVVVQRQVPQLQCGVKVVDIPVVTQRLIPVVLVTIEIPQLHFDKVIDVPVVWSCRSSTRRGAEAEPHGLVDHGDSPAALRPGGRCPWFAGRASSTGAGCDKDSLHPTVADRCDNRRHARWCATTSAGRDSAENCGFSAVAVHRRSTTSLLCRSDCSSWSKLFRIAWRFPSCSLTWWSTSLLFGTCRFLRCRRRGDSACRGAPVPQFLGSSWR